MESLYDLLVPMELKYCERCGGLWFREKAGTEIYCPGCVPLMADMPTPRRKRVVVVAVNSCVAKLDQLSQTLIARVILQGYSHEEAGKVMGCSRRTLERNLPEALDRLSEIFLAAEILEPVEGPRASDEETCQEGEEEENLVIV